MDIDTIIVFKEFYKKNDESVAQTQLDLLNLYQSNGFLAKNIHFIPMPWKNIKNYKQACLMTVQALTIMESNSKGTFFHCTVGEDRTGLLAGLVKVYFENWSVKRTFEKEMCEYGYEAGNPQKKEFVINEIRSSLTPLYLKMATAIKKNKKIDEQLCENLPKEGEYFDGIRSTDLKCSPKNLL